MISDPDEPVFSPLPTRPRDGRDAVDAGLRAAMLDSLGEATIATDPRGRILYWNEAATRLFGWRPEEVVGSDILDVTPSEGMRQAAGAIMETLRRGETWTGEFRVRHRNGTEFPIVATDSPVLDDQGRLIAIVGVSRDISGERAAERALRKSEERLNLVRRAVPSVIWELDPITGRVEWSEAVADVFGYPHAAVAPTVEWWRERVHPADRTRVDRSFERFLEGQRQFWSEEYRFLRADGTWADVFDRAYSTPEGSGDAAGRTIAGAMVDLTEQRHLQDERRLMAQASMILDLSLDYEATIPTLARLVVNSVADFCVVQLQPSLHVAAYTATAHADPGRQAALERIAREIPDRPPPGSLTGRALNDGEPALIRDVPGSARRNAWFCPLVESLALTLQPATLAVVPVRARSDIFGVMIVGNGPERPALEDSELRVAEELGRRIGTAVDHARMFQAEQLANRAKADFLAVMSHELRTPLTAVLGYADLLAGEVSGPLNDQQLRQVGRIRAGTDRLHRLIESILAYVRLETGSEHPQWAAVRMDEFFERVRAVIEPRAEEEGIEFRMSVGETPEALDTDPEWVLQIVLSLLTNALKFAREGTVELRVEGRDGSLVMDVVDSGTGIPEEHQPYIFNAFWQVEQPSTRRAGGAGLGLSVSRRLARLLGGDIVIADSSSAGTTFRFTLPVERPD